jgi:glycosyltransferase involved in cell wall biosynthesis
VKIGVIAPTYLPARRANTMQVMKMAQAFVLNGHAVNMVVPTDSQLGKREDGRIWDDLCSLYGIKHPFPIEWLSTTSNWRRYDYGFLATRWANQQKVDLIYTRLPQAAAISSVVGLPVIFEIHDLPSMLSARMLLRLFLIGRGARRLVVITKALARDLGAMLSKSLASEMMIIEPDGVDLDRYVEVLSTEEARRRLPQDLQGKLGQFVVGYTGHLYPGRGIELIIKLAAELPEITFLIAGGEPEDIQYWQNEVDSFNARNVVLVGFIPNANIPIYQTSCNVLLMPYDETVAASSGGNIGRYLSPMKVFEYMACGRPICSSNLPVLQEILNPNNAVMLSPGDVHSWKQAINNLRVDSTLCITLANQAFQDVQNYSWERRAARILDGL